MTHPDVRRTLACLAASFALAWATVSMVAGPGSAALVAMTGDLSLSGVFIGLFYLSAALGAAVLGRTMDRHGRKRVLIVAHVLAAAGYALAGWGVGEGRLAPFLAGAVVLAFGFGGVNLSRVAAAEIFPPAARGRAVAVVQVSATVGAVVGPLLLVLSGPLGELLGRSPLSLVWFLAPPLLAAAAFVVTRAVEPMAIARDLPRYHSELIGRPPPPVAAAPRRVMVAGFVALAAALAAMAAVMGVAGAAVHHAGHGASVLGAVMFLHFVGMFGLSPLVGRVADRFGRRTTILVGLATLAAGGVAVSLDGGVPGFAVGLLVVGFGWSFAFIGATVLLADVVPPARRAQLLGRADMGAQLVAAAVAVAGGWWFADRGIVGLGILSVAVALVPVVLLALVREPAPGVYGPRDTRPSPLAAQPPSE